MKAAQARRAMAAWGLTALLGACSSAGLGGLSEPTPAPAPRLETPALAAATPPVGQTFGSGPVRVGLILPLTQAGRDFAIGQAMLNAAQMALADGGAGDITLMALDDRSTADSAGSAAQAQVKAGAEIIVGPLFAADVRQVGAVARGAGVPVIAFSTDASVASEGVYLLSFLIETYVDRIVDFAVSRGKRKIAALAPQTDYANVALAELKAEAAHAGASVVAVARYAPGQAAGAVAQLAHDAPDADAIFLPEQPDALPTVAAALAQGGVKAQWLGTGVWNDPRVAALPGLQGAWYSAPDASGFAAFAQRYRAKYNVEPPRLATLCYDAVSLVAALARSPAGQRFKPATLANASGFNGADGLFRFHLAGTNERGLTVNQISPGGVEVISPAPKSFAGG